MFIYLFLHMYSYFLAITNQVYHGWSACRYLTDSFLSFPTPFPHLPLTSAFYSSRGSPTTSHITAFYILKCLCADHQLSVTRAGFAVSGPWSLIERSFVVKCFEKWPTTPLTHCFTRPLMSLVSRLSRLCGFVTSWPLLLSNAAIIMKRQWRSQLAIKIAYFM